MTLDGKTILMPCAALYNEHELWYPYYRLKEAGAAVVLAGPEGGATYTSKVGLPVTADVGYADLTAADYDGVVIPGGYAPDIMRRSPELVAVVREIFDADKLVAHICHAGWLAISADIFRGRTTTSYFAIKDDVINAGAAWVDQEVVVDGNLIGARMPDDLPAFMKAVIAFLEN